MNEIKKLTLKKSSLRNLTQEEIEQAKGAGFTRACNKTKGACDCIHTSAGPSHPIFC